MVFAGRCCTVPLRLALMSTCYQAHVYHSRLARRKNESTTASSAGGFCSAKWRCTLESKSSCSDRRRSYRATCNNAAWDSVCGHARACVRVSVCGPWWPSGRLPASTSAGSAAARPSQAARSQRSTKSSTESQSRSPMSRLTAQERAAAGLSPCSAAGHSLTALTTAPRRRTAGAGAKP